MSHFNVAVITDGTKGVEEMLAPYQENNMCDVPREYLRFYDAAEAEREHYENGGREMVEYKNRLYGPYDEAFKKPDVIPLGFSPSYYEVPEDLPRVTIPFTILCPTIEDYLRDYCGYEDVDPETGRYGYWENPNAKWDWWREVTTGWVDDYMGGAPIRISDLRFDPQGEREKELAWWNENMSGDSANDTNSIIAYFHTSGLDRERFLEASSHLWFRAVVTPDGKWHEVGEMGWFGTSDETSDELYEWALSFEDRFIRPLDPSCVIHVVDCHI